MMYLLLGDEDKLQRSRGWVEDKLAKFDLAGPEGRQRRLKFVVLEALIVVSSLGMMPFTKEEWLAIFADAEKAIDGP